MSIIDIDIDKVVTAAKKFGTHFEIITHDVADTFVKNLASALRSAGVDVVVQEHNNYKFYFEHDVSIIYKIETEYKPVLHNKTLLCLDNSAKQFTEYLTMIDRYNWTTTTAEFVQQPGVLGEPRYILDLDLMNPDGPGSWTETLRTSFTPLLPYRLDHIIFPVYAGPIQEHALDQQSTLALVEYIKQKLYSGYTRIVFDDKDEAMYWGRIYKVHSVIKRLKHIVPDGSFMFLTGALNAPAIYSEWCKSNGIKEELIMIPAARFEAVSKDMMFCNGLVGDMAEIDIPVHTGKRVKKYLCYNRMPRAHRIKVITELHKADLIKEGHVSFHNEDGHLSRTAFQIDALDIAGTHWEDTFTYLLDHVVPELDYVLNKTAERWNPADLQRDDMVHFSESYFSLVNETLFYQEGYQHPRVVDIQLTNSVFLSEKIYKPLACKHPFVVVGVNTTLQHLRKFGYKTFDKWIDESYDLEPDDDTRMDMVLAEVKRLCALSHDEWQVIITEMVPTLQHNFDVLCRAKNLMPANLNLMELFRNNNPY